MRVRRRDLARVPAADFERLAGGSFFASPGFVGLWRHAGGRPVAWIAEDAGRIAALLPGVEYGARPFARFASLPDGCYGGVGLEPGLEAARPGISAALFDAIARHGYAKACVFDFHGSVAAPAGFSQERESTLLTDIGVPGWEPPDAKLRSQIRKAAREGLAVERFDWRRHHHGFLALVRASARRHGQRPRHRAALYAALAALAAGDPRVRWYYAERDGRPVASHIYFVERDALLAWQSHFDRAFSSLKPNQFIRHAACREAAGGGARWLNLGSTPALATGLAYYKARWGGTRVTYASWFRWRGLGALVKALGDATPARREHRQAPGAAPLTPTSATPATEGSRAR